MRVASLHIYPVKGMRAVDRERARVEERGFEHDRRWMVVDATGTFITQRSHPKLATITAVPSDAGLNLSADGMPALNVATPDGSERMRVIVWDASVFAAAASTEAATWLSDYFGERLSLVYMDNRATRVKDSAFVPAPVPVSFADGYPILVTTTGSLAAVNADIVRHGGEAVPMRRFRPNVVIDCDDAWQEDTWQALRIGGVALDLVKPCERCIVTTTDQSTGERKGPEPIAALTRLRRSGDPRISGVLFAWNAVPRARGEIALGDAVEVLEDRPEGFPLRQLNMSPES
jgi:uncharacterized protein YcbX